MTTAMKPTQLGGIVKNCRKIKKWLKFMELRAETKCIVDALRARAATELSGTDDEALENTVQGALAVADHADEEHNKHPNIMTGQPEEQAAVYIRNRLNLPSLLD